MQRILVSAVFSLCAAGALHAGPLNLNADTTSRPGVTATRDAGASAGEAYAQVRNDSRNDYYGQRAANRSNLGGGFFEALFGDLGNPNAPRYEPAPQRGMPASYGRPYEPEPEPEYLQPGEPARPALSPRYMKQVVQYDGREKPGTIIINTRERLLYLVQGGGTAVRYGIGVGKPGFQWAGVHHVSQKREWPGWTPPAEMLKRRPDLPRHMEGGPDNPLGARAMYLGSTLYRIHGSNEPWTIGTAVSSGCIRMRNEDVIDLYTQVKVGTKVIVI
jgi:lipoprotein-anchoring transpeptidase ErfK/SrfK